MRHNRRGFTLAELLIVVAIVAVLVAIAVPYYTAGLEKSREAADIANIRHAYNEVLTHFTLNGEINTIEVPAEQRVAGWQSDVPSILVYIDSVQVVEYTYDAETSGTYSVSIELDANTGEATPSVS